MVHVPVPFKHFMVTPEGCKLLSTVEPQTSKSGNLSEQAAALGLLTERMTCRKSGSSLSFESTHQIAAVPQTHPTDEVTVPALH
jgi:hypothetical protein